MEVFLNRVSQPRSEVRALYVVMGEAIGAVPEVSEEVAAFTEHTVRSVTRLIKEGVKCGELRSDLMLERVIEPELKHVGVNGVTLAYWERSARRDDLPTLLFVHATGFHGGIFDRIIESFPECGRGHPGSER